MKKRGILCFLFCIIMCSSIDVTLKLASLRMNAIQLCFWRFLCGGLSCLPIALRTVNEQRKAKAFLCLIFCRLSFFLPLAITQYLC